MEEKFEHRVSKGTRFNQIYVPQNMKEVFEVGDIVEVKLLSKQNKLFYSKNTKKLGEFKEELIKKIFSYLSKIKDVKQAFIFGSFLTQKEYNDIDILIVSDKEIETKVYNYILEKIQLKFHIISINQSRLNELVKVDPLTRSMLYYSISNKKVDYVQELEIDKNHIEFLLMMPEDLLKINVESKVFYDVLRRLITIRVFLDKEEEDPLRILKELTSSLGEELYFILKSNKFINQKQIEVVRNEIKKQIKLIRDKL